MEDQHFHSIEKSGTPKKLDHIERRFHEFKDSETDRDNSLREARQNLLENEKLFRKFIGGMEMDENRDATDLASLENIFVSNCLNLTDSEIKILVDNFNKNLSYFIANHKGEFSGKYIDPETIFSKRISSEGIIGVINFIRREKESVRLKPAQNLGFYFEDVLDAKYKIDIVVCIYTVGENEKIHVDRMNLVQVKSSEPRGFEREKIVESHRSWAVSSVMDFESFEHEYTDGEIEASAMEELLKNFDEIKSMVEDLYTDPKGFRPEAFFDLFVKKLKLENLSDKKKAWILYRCIKDLKKDAVELVERGVIGEEVVREIIQHLENLEVKLRAKAKLPKDLSYVDEINSVLAIGQKRIILEKILEKSSDNRRKKLLSVHS